MKTKPIRHGELLINPIDEKDAPDMTDAVFKNNYVASHSETGHHHIISGDSMVLERPGQDTFVELKEPTEVRHNKTSDKHETLPLKAGIYRLLKKKEYDPFGKAMREVLD